MQAKGIYRQRKPERTPLYQLMLDHFETLRDVYDDKYGDEYGFFRPEIDAETFKYQKCGIPKYGFARIRCTTPGCDESNLLPFSCHSRSFCPSCMQKNMLETGEFIVHTVAEEVPHRHIVFTIPKLMRKNFYWHRESLNDLSRMAWKCTLAFMRGTLKRNGRPGAILGIETSGQFLDLNPHIHEVTSDGLFDDNGNFYLMPRCDDRARACLQAMWENEVSKYVIRKQYVNRETVSKVLNFRHTGFSVFLNRRVDFKKSNDDSVKEFEQLARYIAKPHFSLEAMEYVKQTGKVVYHGSMHPGKRRNFEIFDACDFLAAVTSHIPKKRQKYINSYGVYSNKTRGMQAKAEAEDEELTQVPASADYRANKRTWAILINKIWEVDPLKCLKCGGVMKVISIIDAKQADVIQRILKSLGLWTEEAPRAPPRPKEQPELELTYVPIVDDWWVGVDLFEPAQAEGTMYGFDDAAQTGDSNADQVCETDTDADQTERWYEAIVDDWGLRSEFADA